MAVGGCSQPGLPVVGCYLQLDKRFGFVEFRCVEEASNAMAFDGVLCQVRTEGVLVAHGLCTACACTDTLHGHKARITTSPHTGPPTHPPTHNQTAPGRGAAHPAAPRLPALARRDAGPV
jgi:hypothetical protein